MKQLISYYRMPGDREEEISRLIHAEGLDGMLGDRKSVV